MTGTTRARVALVLDHPAQHFTPAFRDLESSSVVEPHVLYWASGEGGLEDPGFGQSVEWDVDLLSGYFWWAPSRRASQFTATIATIRQLEQVAPDVVLCWGWGTHIAQLTIAWALTRGTPLMLYGDSTWQHERRGALGLGRAAVLRLVFRRAHGALSTGTFNREFYIRHGMPPDRISPGVCPADVELYRAASDGSRQASVPLVIGFAGKLIPRKGAHELLSALALLPPGAWKAEIVGDGPERHRLEALANALGLDGQVRFAGFVNQSEMPAFLAACDVVVVPSTVDMRVLVVIETMAAGTPVIVSSNTAVWGTGDLVEHGTTGLVYRSGDPGDLAACIRSLIADPDRIRSLSEAASAQVDQYGPAAFRARLEEAVVRRLQ